MTNPITPPPELVEKWAYEWNTLGVRHSDATNTASYVAIRAAQWGADQQLEQCVAWLDGYEREGWAAEQMRSDCRPQPPSLKEQALKELRQLSIDPELGVCASALDTIRQALEALDG